MNPDDDVRAMTIDYGVVNGKRITRRFSEQQLRYLAVPGLLVALSALRERTREWAESMPNEFAECAANRFGRASGTGTLTEHLDDHEDD